MTTKLELDEARQTVRLRESGMQLDVGGIAKGFAADEAAAVLATRGITRALVAAGGDIVAGDAPLASTAGRWPSRRWRRDRPPAGYAALRNAAVSTSGDAEQFFVVERRPLLAHLRSAHRPGADRPEQRDGGGPEVTTSDALATAVAVTGGERGAQLADATPGAAALRGMRGAGTRRYESSRWRALGGFAGGNRRWHMKGAAVLRRG